MAVLSTVIGRGASGSKPGSPAEGYLYYSTDLGVLERYSGSAWEQVGSAGIMFTFSTTTADADPGAGTMRFDNATPASVTNAYLDDNCLGSNADLGTALAALNGAVVLFQQLGDDAKFIAATVGTVTDGTGYWKLALTVDSSGTLPDNGAIIELLIFGGGGGGGGDSRLFYEKVNEHTVIQEYYFTDGNIIQGRGGSLPTLQAGTADTDGKTGAGSYTELDVACSCFFDISPSANAGRGWVALDQDVQADIGLYFRTSMRPGELNDQHFSIGWVPGNTTDNPDTLTTNGGAYFYAKDTDTNWQFRTTDGSAGTTTDTGVAKTDTWHNFEIYMYNDGGNMRVKAWIDGTLVANHVDGTDNVFLGTTVLSWVTCRSHFKTGGATATYDQAIFCNGFLLVSQDSDVIKDLGWATALT